MKNIFVSNLGFGSSEASVRQLFEAYGVVQRVNLVTNRDTGRARGFGFVEMENAAAATRAINELDGQNFEGRTLKVIEARPKN